VSGIAAVFEFGPPVQAGRLDAMAVRMEALGPDGAGTLLLGEVGLVCCLRGDLTPEDAYEAQPVRSPDGRFAGVFDGRIDNRDDVRRRLGLTEGAIARTPDSALFLQAWERWGVDACTTVVGPFAAIIWNLSSHELVAVRDPIGERVLYHHASAGRLVIASSPSAIHASGVPRRLDEVKVADSLILNYREASRSFFEGISRLPAGHRLHVTRDRAQVQRYYDIAELEPLHLRSDDDYVDAAHEALDTATRAMLRTTAPPSLSLSSGLDSTMVATAMLPILRERGETLHAYTSVPVERWRPDPAARRNGDERSGVDAFLAMHPEIEHTYVRAGGRGLFDYLDTIIDGADAPPRNAMNLFWIHEIHRLTRDRGARVVFTGGGGNMTLGWDGATLPVDLLRMGHFRALARELTGDRRARVPVLQPLFTDLVLPYAPRRAWLAYRRVRGATVHRWSLFSAVNPAYAEAMEVDRRAEAFGFDDGFRPPRGRAEAQAAFMANAFQEGGDIRRGMSAVHGTEMRDPTMDRRVVELAFRIPPGQFRRNGERRWLQKRMLAGQAPPAVLDPRRRGVQAADARLRIGADLGRIRIEVDEAAADPQLSRMLDVDALRASLRAAEWWTADQDPSDPGLGVIRLSRALATARFVQAVRDPQASRIPVAPSVDVREAVPVPLVATSADDTRRSVR
jgi:asparagine synthase (glutamine-hydrolysing)